MKELGLVGPARPLNEKRERERVCVSAMYLDCFALGGRSHGDRTTERERVAEASTSS